jgi:hypothetical protein|tara:strand:- start:2071 stop:2292 length:222 start_codon:yes stop_codon:yes gene_type:complete
MAAKKSSIDPVHYNCYAIQPIEFIMKNKLSYCVGNIIKYVVRHKHKNGREDLMKARQYIDFLIKEWDNNEKQK